MRGQDRLVTFLVYADDFYHGRVTLPYSYLECGARKMLAWIVPDWTLAEYEVTLAGRWLAPHDLFNGHIRRM